MLYRSLCVLAVAALAASVQGQTFTNPANITIPNIGNGTPYPSTIGVVGGPASITSISVRFHNLTHTFSADIDVLLVGPGGQSVVLMSDCGGGTFLSGDTFTFTSIAGAPQATFTPFEGGTYSPTNSTNAGTEAYGPPAPAGPYGADFSAMLGTNANGTWSLYVVDDQGSDVGSMAGWSITFNEGSPGAIAQTSNIFTYQGKLTNGATAVNGNVDLRFSFWRNATSVSPGAAVGSSPTINNVAVTDGLFTVQVDAGDAFFDNKELWLQIEVRNPAGGGSFVALDGRQRVTPAPAAQWASGSDRSNRVTSPDSLLSLVTTDNSGNIGIGRSAGQLGGGTVVIEGRLGTGAGSFGGMYVNTPHADSWPFMGFSTAGAIQSYWWHDPALDGIRFSNGTQLRNTGEVSIDGAPVAGFTLSVNGSLRCVGLTNASSARYKTDVEPLGSVLDRFSQLQPVTYVWNEEAPTAVRGQKTTGLIAEEVYKLFPDAISLDTQGRPDGIDYSRVTAISIQAFKELQAKQAAKDAEIEALKARLEAIERLLEKSAK